MMKTFTKKIAVLASFLFMGMFTMAQFNVTFHVNMTDVEIFNPDSQSVYIAGSFLGWEQPGTNPNYMLMPNEDDPMIYEIMFELAEVQEIQYKYFLIESDPSWDMGEWTGDPNRTVVPIEEVTIEDVWAQTPQSVTFNVDLMDADPFDPATDEIFISGSVCIPNNWSMPGSVANYKLTAVESKEMIYSITLLLYPGDYQYKFFRVIEGEASWDNGEWTGDPNRDVSVDSAAVTEDKVWGLLSGIHNPSVQSFSVYPNPVNDDLILQDVRDANLIEVYNISGELVKRFEQVTSESLNINTSDFTQGIYMVSIHRNGVIHTAKFLKK